MPISMKKLLFLISLILLLISCHKEISDVQSEYFVKFYGDEFDDFGNEVGITSDGGYVIAATTERSATGNTDIMIIRTNKFGIRNAETIYYGGEGDEECKGLLVMDDGYVVTGAYKVDGGESIILLKFGIDGNLMWSGPLDSLGQGNDIEYINNEIVLTGYISPEPKKPMFWRFSPEGESIDRNSPTFSPGDYLSSVFSRDGKLFGFGTSYKTSNNTDLFITGTSIEPKYFDLGGNETSSGITKSASGGFFITGTTDPIGSGFSQVIVKKLNDDFSENLSFNTNPLGNDGDYRGVDIQELEDGGVAVLGDRTFNNDTDIVLYILNPDGSTRYVKYYGKTGNQSASSLKLTPDGGLIILGSNQQEKTNSMITLIKTDKDGNIWE